MTNKVYGERQKQAKSLSKLKRRFVKAWKLLDSKMLRKVVHQMPLRMKEIIGGRVANFEQHCQRQLCRINI